MDLIQEIPMINILETEIPQEVIQRLPAKFVNRYQVIPVKMDNNTLTIATADPLDLHTLDDIGLLLGCKIEVVLTTPEEIDQALQKYYGSGSQTVQDILSTMTEKKGVGIDEGKEVTTDLESLAHEAPVIKLVNLIIMEAIKKRASDIHIEPFEDEAVVRYRIDGVLYDTSPPPKWLYPAIVSRIKLMAEMNIAERRLPQDGRIQLKVGGKQIDMRVSTLPTLYGESLVLRILEKETILIGLDELGFEELVLAHFRKLITKSNGIILVTGPTGSGKTTTLYAALNEINSTEKKIITIEDPIEYQLKRINQLQVKSKINFSFAQGLRSMLRQDPDIMMVGEIRDLETAEVAVQSALTGHLVFSTLHTNDAASAITRLHDMGIEDFLISSSVIGILAQRLVRLICPECREEYLPKPELVKEFHSKTLFKGRGCENCNYSGFKGRIGIFELLVVNDEIRDLILQKTNANKIKEHAVNLGMKPMYDDGLQKVQRGLTTLEDVLRVVQEEEG
ncbi:MAG: type II secretion system ATPase GspE [Nitrospirota bacterium]